MENPTHWRAQMTIAAGPTGRVEIFCNVDESYQTREVVGERFENRVTQGVRIGDRLINNDEIRSNAGTWKMELI